MGNYSYVAIDPRGAELRGVLEVPDQSEALRRIKEMGLYPTKVREAGQSRGEANRAPARGEWVGQGLRSRLLRPFRRVGPRLLVTFTRQLATLIEAGMPLLRGLRLLREQAENRSLKSIIDDLSKDIENGSCFSEAVSLHPRTFSRLYVNMIKAGEIGGALEVTLKRLAEFMEKSRKIKGRIKSAMFYPCAVLTVAVAILGLMMVFIIPRFASVFQGLLNGRPLPAFTLFVLRLSEVIKGHMMLGLGLLGVVAAIVLVGVRTRPGQAVMDRMKLTMPLFGPVFKKSAISRFARTLGTLAGSGVPLLQALTIVEETAGNLIVGRVIARVRENVKQGDPIAATLKASGIFPSMVAGMVDVGEQTGALPEMLMKVADTYDEEVDNAVGAMVSLLEPIMIVFLAVVVGSIVIAMFLPLVSVIPEGNADHDNGFSL